jgi:hypothetical protein
MNYSAEDLMRMAQAGARNKIARYSIYGSTTTTVATTATTTTYIAPIMSGLGDNVFLYIYCFRVAHYFLSMKKEQLFRFFLSFIFILIKMCCYFIFIFR